MYISRCYLEIAIAKRCRLHKLIRQRFALALKIQKEDFALIISAVEATVDVLRFSRWISADDVIGDVIIFSRWVEQPVASYSAISRCYLKIAIAKRCRLHKLIRQRFALALKIQQKDFALLFQQTKLQWIQSQRKDIQTQLMNQTQATAASSRELI
ncbi:hypothetical protein F511_20511 [Dorcoceras hygrometricum]|uniref:Uncharacterized protein n=1 Tax=Dorcoceras hygrometricum TaxID=472368 RepID=A0A2Z7CGT7_9LAMI|nr:hypothetical protein F511_20511 [Dorcoceras hygrometricum]